MHSIHTFPKDKARFTRLLGFATEVVSICDELDIDPVLSGSLAVLAYTADENMTVNDVDLSCQEGDFAKLMDALNRQGITHRLKAWHVLQVRRDGLDTLKVEFDAQEYWMPDMPKAHELLCVGDLTVKMVSLDYLRELYRRGLEDTAAKNDENSRRKHVALKAKYDALKDIAAVDGG